MPFGLQTDPQVTTIVGNDAQLTCRASKYIYSNVGWYYPSSEAAPSDSVIKKIDKYSISLTLVIANVTKEHGGLYKCRAENQHNSTDTLEQHTQLLVRGGSCHLGSGEGIAQPEGLKCRVSAAPFEALQSRRWSAFPRESPNTHCVVFFHISE